MNPDDSQNLSPRTPVNQQQSFGEVQVQGDDNLLNVIQAQVVTLTQTKIIQISVDEIKTRELIVVSPYKGLKKFEPEDSDRFFGRDQFIGGLVNELEQTNFVLLLGASGSGKSSVVRAGLMPWLQQTWGKQFVSLVLTPDSDPFESLYGSLLSRGFSQAQAQAAKVDKAETLSQVVTTLKPTEAYWLIFIDQFEELFTVSEAKKRDSFIHSLVKLSKDRASDATLKIVATLRADFLDQLDPAPANRLARLTEKHRPLITQMHPDELRLAIEQPAAHHGVVFETGLVEDIIKDVQGQAGYLPLLQYTLDLLWESEAQNGSLQDRTLRSSTYRRLGGVRGALQQRVDEIYQGLSELQQLAVQRIFLKLVEIGDDEAAGTGWKPVRRRAARVEFADEAEQRVLSQLINANLLVSDAPVEPVGQRQAAGAGATVEIAHEILLTSWTTLHGWIKQNRQSIALRNRLNDDVALWQTQKEDSDLWGGSKLAQVVELRQDQVFQQVLGGFSPGANQFIEASVGLRDRQRQRLIAGAVAFCTVIAASGIGFGIQQQRAKQAVEAVFLSADSPTPTLLNRLPDFLEAANQRRAKVDQLRHRNNPDQALAYYQEENEALSQVFAYYRKILTVIIRLQKQNELQQNPELKETQATATAALAELLSTYRLPQLQKELEMKQYGEVKPEGRGTDRFTQGALRTTSEILMVDAGADLDSSGDLQTLDEAEQIPCATLEAVEKLWQKLVDKQCAWFIANLENGEFEAPGCQPTNRLTLSYSLFDANGYESIIDRLKQCRANDTGT